MRKSEGRQFFLFTCAIYAVISLAVRCIPTRMKDEASREATEEYSTERRNEASINTSPMRSRKEGLSASDDEHEFNRGYQFGNHCRSEGQSLSDQAKEFTNNLTFLKGRQAGTADMEVCPDGTNPLKYCCRSVCPFGYYCFYGVCCKHLKPGTCPISFASTGIPAGPPCDNDLECPWRLKCCEVNNRTRCVFPNNYIGGTGQRLR